MTAEGTVCVYTTVFEGFDDLKPQPPQNVPCDFYCFTDAPERVTVAPWRPVRVDDRYLPGAEPRLVSRYIKNFSPRALGEIPERHDLSIWVDARRDRRGLVIDGACPRSTGPVPRSTGPVPGQEK